MFPFSLHLSISSWLAVEAFSVTIDTNLIRRPKSHPKKKASRATKTTATTKGHTKPKLVGTEKDSASIEKNHQKRTPQEVYRLLLLISRSAATGEKGKKEEKQRNAGKSTASIRSE